MSRSSDYVADSAVATISVPVFMFIELCSVFGALEAFIAIGTLYCVLDRLSGAPRRTSGCEGSYTGTGKVWFAEVSTRFCQLDGETGFKCLLGNRHCVNLIRRIGLDAHL